MSQRAALISFVLLISDFSIVHYDVEVYMAALSLGTFIKYRHQKGEHDLLFLSFSLDIPSKIPKHEPENC